MRDSTTRVPITLALWAVRPGAFLFMVGVVVTSNPIIALRVEPHALLCMFASLWQVYLIQQYRTVNS